jgi:probable rRNA maturation factor
MSQNIQFFTEDISFTVKNKNLLREWITGSIQFEGFKTGDLNIILCSDEYLHGLNIKYLGHDTLTDIITFDNSSENTVSGDLFISIERIRENAGIFSKTIADELHRVIIHGVLHLIKYGDKTEAEKVIMTERENAYLSRRPDRLKVS